MLWILILERYIKCFYVFDFYIVDLLGVFIYLILKFMLRGNYIYLRVKKFMVRVFIYNKS